MTQSATKAMTNSAEMPASQPQLLQCRTNRCGRCHRCLDNARWERIFAEKFADPTYYEKRLVSHSSPLA
jgi:hypothetical protein